MIQIPHLDILKKYRSKIIWGIILFWFLMAVLVFSSEFIATKYFGAPVADPIEIKQYLLRWISWLVLTPVIIFLALTINIGNVKLAWFVLIHLVLATLLLGVEFIIELSVLKPLAASYYNRIVTLNEIALPFLSKYFAYVVNYFLLVGIVNMFVYMKNYQQAKHHVLEVELKNKELEFQLALAHLQTLKMQIRPHFLFNTLNAIHGLIVKQHNDQASFMLTRLSDLLRKTLEKQEDEFVALSEELHMIQLYVDIQQIRFKERLVYFCALPEEAKLAKVPFFVLQPLIENAVKYGVEQTDDKVYIEVVITIQAGQLHIQIQNSGRRNSQIENKGLGIGLSNVKARLQQYYGAASSLEIQFEGEDLTRVHVHLPYERF